MCRRLATWTRCIAGVQRFGAGGSGTKHQGPFRSQDKFDVIFGMPVRFRVDCIEWHVTDETDARRLRAQRRYFGIAGEDSNESIKLAKDYGERAYRFVSAQLSKPFTVHTAFADARGDGRHHHGG